LCLGLETSRDPFLQVLVSVLVLNLAVLVLVLDKQVLNPSLPSYLQTNIIAQMLSIRGEAQTKTETVAAGPVLQFVILH